MMDLSEQRKFVRFEIPLTILFRDSSPDSVYQQGVACNFSRDGLCLIAPDFPFPAQSLIEVRLDVPDKNNALVISGEVMWKTHCGDRWQAGLRFKEIDRTGKMDVLEYAYSSWLGKIRNKPR